MLHSYKNLGILLLIIALSRIIVISLFGLQYSPDSLGYLDYANALNSITDWTDQPKYDSRIAGYPYLIAGFQNIFSENWEIFFALFQVSISLLAITCLYFSALSLFENQKLAILACYLYAFSIFFFLDTVLLTDSMAGHLFTIIFSILILVFCSDNPASLRSFLLCGILLMGCFLLREGTLYLVVPTLPFLFYVLWTIFKKQSFGRAILCGILYLLPLILTHHIILNYNEDRTGNRFITTGAHTVYAYALAKAYAAYFPEVFSAKTEFDRSFQEHVKTGTFLETLGAINHLKSKGWSEFEIMVQGRQKYIEKITHNPAIAAYIIADNIKPNTPISLFQPILALGQMISRHGKHYKYWRSRFVLSDIIKNHNVSLIAPFVGMAVETAISLCIFAGFIILLPYHLYTYLKNNGFSAFCTSKEGLFFTLSLLYIGFWLIHALVHLEARYHAGVNMVVLLSSMYVLKEYVHRLPRAISRFLT